MNEFDFNRIAAGYDKWYYSLEGSMYDKLEKMAIDKFFPKSTNGKQLLEVGCGTGHWSGYFSKGGFVVTGIDKSEKMIDIAASKDIPNCRFHSEDAHNISFDDNRFDIAAAITVLEFTDRPEKIVSEMSRCVKPGGKLLFGVLNALSSFNLKRQQKTKSVYAYANLFSPLQLRQLLEKFGNVRICVAGFMPRTKLLIWISPFWDRICRFFRRKNGTFIAAEVQL